jgi:hypothetical protein
MEFIISRVGGKTTEGTSRRANVRLDCKERTENWKPNSRKSEEVITDEPHAGKLARVVLAGLSFGI